MVANVSQALNIINMLSINLESPKAICAGIAARAVDSRKRRGWTQEEVSGRSGIALSTLRLFEQTGRISLERLVKLAILYDDVRTMSVLFGEPEFRSLDDLERGRVR